jgi:alpha-tubulin suppressor-like RCC1 family protein
VFASFTFGAASASADTISVGPGHSCSTRGGEVLCWGLDYSTNAHHKVPVRVSGLPPSVQVATGNRFNCAVAVAGTIACWGDGGWGQLGYGGTSDSGTPMPVAGITNAVSATAGGYHACAVLSSGHVDCWGRNFYGALGNGSSLEYSPVPVEVTGIANAVAVSTNDHYDETCALLSTGGVDCWGAGGQGQLGNGGKRLSPVPVAVSGITEATAIAAGGQHACAVLAGGRLVCWGEQSTTPHTVNIPPVASVSVALGETCAVLTNGEARCWGMNKRGQNGSGIVGVESDVPRPVSGVHTAVMITAALFHNCVLFASGEAACWGYNDYGDLGANLEAGTFPTPQKVLFPPPAAPSAAPAAQPPAGGAPTASTDTGTVGGGIPVAPGVQLAEPPPSPIPTTPGKPVCASVRRQACPGGGVRQHRQPLGLAGQ